MPDQDGGLRWNANDRSFTIPTKAKDERGRKRRIKLEEPNVEELGEIQSLMEDAEEQSPQVDTIPDGQTDAKTLATADSQVKARAHALFVADKPFAEAIVKVVELLSDGESITAGELPGWCSSPLTLQHMVNRWRDPLAG